MISAADFSDVFPAMAEPEPAGEAHRKTSPPYDPCIARWEDDGGLIADHSHGRTTPHAGVPCDNHGGGKSIEAGILLHVMPVATLWATCCAFWLPGAILMSRQHNALASRMVRQLAPNRGR